MAELPLWAQDDEEERKRVAASDLLQDAQQPAGRQPLPDWAQEPTAPLKQEQEAYEQANPPLTRFTQRLRRGYLQALQSEHTADASALAETIIAGKAAPGDFEAFTANISNATRLSGELQKIPVAPVSRAMTQAKTLGEAGEAFAADPIAATADVGVTSAVQSSPVLAAGATAGLAGLGRAGAAAAVGGMSAKVDYAAELSAALADYGVDISNPKELSSALRDPDVLEAIKKRAGLHATFVGLLDAVSAGVATKVLAPASIKSKIAREAVNIPGQVVAQGTAGGAGEALGQLASEQQLKPGEILGEVVGEAFGAPGDVAALALSGARRSGGTPVANEGALPAWAQLPPEAAADEQIKLSQTQSAPSVAPRPQQYTLRALGLIPGEREMISRESVEQTLNRQDVKDSERTLIRSVLDEHFAGQARFSRRELESRVAEVLPPLSLVQLDQYANYGLDRIGVDSEPLQWWSGMDFFQLDELQAAAINSPGQAGVLARQLRKVLEAGDRAVTAESQKLAKRLVNVYNASLPVSQTHVWSLPWVTSRATHFPTASNYAVHTRVFDRDGIRSIGEVQTDLGQRRDISDEERAQLRKDLKIQMTLTQELEKELALLGEKGLSPPVLMVEAARITKLLQSAQLTAQEITNKLASSAPIAGIGDHLYALALREENRQAARDGVKTLRFATPETVSKIEGWDKLAPDAAQARGVPGLLRRYEKLAKLVKKEFNAAEVKDDRGNSWLEWAVDPKAAEQLVQYYNKRPIGAGHGFTSREELLSYVESRPIDIKANVWAESATPLVDKAMRLAFGRAASDLAPNEIRVLGFDEFPDFIAKVMPELQSWVKRFAPDMNIVIAEQSVYYSALRNLFPERADNFRDTLGGMNFLHNGTLLITINKNSTGPVSAYRFWHETLAHEFGHALAQRYLWHLPGDARIEVLRDLRELRTELLHSTIREALAKRNPIVIFIKEMANLRDEQLDMTVADYILARPDYDIDYFISADELMANQYAKWAQRGNPTTLAERIWARLGHLLSRFFDGISLSWFKPRPSFDTFLRGIVALHSGVRQTMVEQQFNELYTKFGENKSLTQTLSKMQASTDRYSWWLRQSDGLIDLAKRNAHIPSLQAYIAAVRKWASVRSHWFARADGRIHEWIALGKDQANRLAKLLLDETISEKHFDLQDPAVLKKYGIEADALKLLAKIKEDFALILDVIETTLISEAQRKLAGQGEALALRIADIQKDFKQMRARPYFPLPRFGNYTVVMRAQAPVTIDGKKYQAGQLIEMQMHEGKGNAHSSAESLRAKYSALVNSKQITIGEDMLPEETAAFSGMPQAVLENLAEILELDSQQVAALKQYQYDIAPGQSWRKHLMKRQNIAGFSEDAMRGYASYMFHAANHIARIMHYREMSQTVQETHTSATRIQRRGGNAVTRRQIAEHLKRHLQYIMNPQNEWEGLRAFAFVYYLSLVPRAAIMNMMQVPMVTAPYLTKRFGVVDASAELLKAWGDMTNLWRNPAKASPDIVRLVEEGKAAGFLDESYAQELAGITTGNALDRMLPQSQAGYRLRQFGRVGAFLFHNAEKLNRLGTAIAAYNLARKRGMDHQKAFEEARLAVDTTHFEYAKWNRPEAFRGKIKGNVLVFKRYMLGMIKFLGNDPGALRALAMIALLAGLTGLPFAEDLLDLASWLGRKVTGRRFDAEAELAELINDAGGKPELLLHGVSRYAGPFDMSGSLSLGDIVPYTKALGEPGDFENKLPKMIQETGALLNVPLQMMQAAQSNNPDNIRRLEPIMPVWARNITKAWRFAEEGAATTPRGEALVRFDPSDPLAYWTNIGGQALGFTPRELSRAYERRNLIHNAMEFYRLRREALLNAWALASLRKDREAMADAKKEIRDFNAAVRGVDPLMYIDGRSMADARIRRLLDTTKAEKGVPPELRQMHIYKDANKLLREGVEEVTTAVHDDER